MRIKTNVAAINTTRNQGIAQNNLSKSLEKLSSGYAINRAGDNSAGLAISEGMRSQINGLNQAIRNTDDGIGMANTGEGSLQEVHSMLHRLKTLASQSANGTYSDLERENIENEFEEICKEIDRIGSSTDFDGIELFDNEDPGPAVRPLEAQKKDDITIQIGRTEGETMPITRYKLGSKALGLQDVELGKQAIANKSIDYIDQAIQAVSSMRASFGASSTHLQHTKNSLGVASENATSAEGCIRDTDMSEEMTKYTSKNIIMQSAQAMMAQANSMPQIILSMLQQ